MLRFFSKIRYQIAAENKAGKVPALCHWRNSAGSYRDFNRPAGKQLERTAKGPDSGKKFSGTFGSRCKHRHRKYFKFHSLK